MRTITEIATDEIRAAAEEIVLTGSVDPEMMLACEACLRTIDPFPGAHDDAVAAVVEFIEHTAFDHSGRATILFVSYKPYARVAR
jgi:hypothetical protein